MALDTSQQVTVVGAGPVGCVLATLLAQRGYDVVAYEKLPDMRRADLRGGRSINLVLTERGLRALGRIGLRNKVLELTVPVLGRMMHDRAGELAYQPYGKDESECNYSVSRGGLNRFLLDAAEEAGVELHFEHELVGVDFDDKRLRFATGDEQHTDDYEVLFGADGAPSTIRKTLMERPGYEESVEFMNWGYKELIFPADDGDYAMDRDSLHIWPRGDHFLMGLANLDGSFTGTAYLPMTGDDSFEQLQDPDSVDAFFQTHYPDAVDLLGDFVDEFLAHPTGVLGTVRCAPWHLDDQVLLLGDAAHGIVPFFGQGLNSGFEDCVVLDDLLSADDDLSAVFETFFERRKPNTDAIADMALENAIEMGKKVGDPDFLMQKKVESILENELGDRYRSRYAMVMYSHLPYRVAFAIGEEQKEILARLAAGLDAADEVDLDEARRLIDDRLIPLYERHDVDLDF